MITLTPEQIADGWIAYTGQSLDSRTVVQIYTPAEGSERGQVDDFDWSVATADDYDNDPIGAVNNFITMYRTFSPDRPEPTSAPVWPAFLVSALISKNERSGTTIYGHRAMLIRDKPTADAAKSTAMEEFMKDGYRLESLYLKEIEALPQQDAGT